MTAPSAPAVVKDAPYIIEPFGVSIGDVELRAFGKKDRAEEWAKKVNDAISAALSTHYLDPMRKAVEALKKTEHPDWLCAGWHEVDDIQGLGFVREDCNCYVGEAEDGLRSALGVK